MITKEKDRDRILKKVGAEIGYLERSEKMKSIEIDFTKMSMTYVNYHDAVAISQSILPKGWTFRWVESKKGTAILKKQ